MTNPAERLAQFAAVYDAAEAEAEAATERLDALKAAVKAELYAHADAQGLLAAPSVHITFDTPALRAPWVLDYRVAQKIDTKSLRAKHPEIAEQFTKPSGAWYLTRGAST